MNAKDTLKFISLALKREKGFKNLKKDSKIEEYDYPIECYKPYLKFQEFQMKEFLKRFKKNKIDLSKMKVLELAVGIGGFSSILRKNSKKLIINDLRAPPILKIDPKLNFKKFDATKKYPFKSNYFDVVFCCSLIEHVSNPEEMFAEIQRVLKPNGFLLLTFPPFYTPVGGHYFKPFHLLGEKVSIKIINLLKKQNIKNYATVYDKNYGLHKRTIGGVKNLLKSKSFLIKDIWTKFFFINFAKIPVLNEFLTWHVCFLCQNKGYYECKCCGKQISKEQETLRGFCPSCDTNYMDKKLRETHISILENKKAEKD